MAGINPIQILSLAKKNNPRLIAEQLIQQNFPNDPMMQTLLQMGRQGNDIGVKNFAQQILQSQGKDFNVEMEQLFSLLNQIG